MNIFLRILLSILIGTATAIVFFFTTAVLFTLIDLFTSLSGEFLGGLGIIMMVGGAPVAFIVGAVVGFIKLKGKQKS